MTPDASTATRERLADATSASKRRMLMVVNPYATTVSARLRQLVVATLQRRFEVDAVDTQRKGHAIELSRDAASRATTSWSRSAATARSTRPPTGWPARTQRSPACRAARPTSTAACSASRATSSPPLSACSAAPRPGSPRRRPRARQRPWFTFSAGAGLDASVVERVDSNPRLKARFGPWYYAQAAVTTFLKLRRQPAARHRDGRGAGDARRERLRPELPALTFFRRRPVRLAAGDHLAVRRSLRRRPDARQRTRPADDHLPAAGAPRRSAGTGA